MASIREEYTIINLHDFISEKVVCLTLDVEQDYAGLLDEPSYEGLSHIETLVDFLKERDIPLTCFIQGSLFETHSNELKKFLALDDIEFELHSYSHSNTQKSNIAFEVKRGKEAYEKFFGKNPIGYRSPNGIIKDMHYQILASNGFKFDSSIFPSLRPGAFNNLGKPTRPYLVNNAQIIEFPFTVFSNLIRVPMSLSYIKLFGKLCLYLLKSFELPDFIIFNLHLHDLFELDSSKKMPLSRFSPIYRLIFKRLYQKRKSNCLAILDELIAIFHQKDCTFSKLDDIYKSISEVR